MEDEDQHIHENHQSNFSNSNNTDESKDYLDTKPHKKEEEGYKGKPLMKKNQIQGNHNESGKRIVGCKGKKEKSRESGRKSHKWIQKERREKMGNLFDSVHALLPQLPTKAGKSTIVGEAVDYITSLEHTVEKLEQLKQERLKSISTFGRVSFINDSKEKFISHQGSSNTLACGMPTSYPSNSNPATVPQNPVSFQTWYSPNVVLNIYGAEAEFSVFTPRKANLMTTIVSVLDKCNIEVTTANIFCNDCGYFGCMILVKANVGSPHQFIEKSFVNEIYKQAAEEIKLFISKL